MKRILFISTIALFIAVASAAQSSTPPVKKYHIPHGTGKRDNYEVFMTPGAVNRADGYIVYNEDTIKGLISFNKFDLFLEQPINKKYSYYYHFKWGNPKLKTLLVYNIDNKQLCLTRVKKRHRLMRLIHEGKLSIYDDRFTYIYSPRQVDKNLIVIAYNGKVKELGSFFTASTKRNLVSYVNTAYDLNIDPKSISWRDLLLTVDGLE